MAATPSSYCSPRTSQFRLHRRIGRQHVHRCFTNIDEADLATLDVPPPPPKFRRHRQLPTPRDPAVLRCAHRHIVRRSRPAPPPARDFDPLPLALRPFRPAPRTSESDLPTVRSGASRLLGTPAHTCTKDAGPQTARGLASSGRGQAAGRPRDNAQWRLLGRTSAQQNSCSTTLLAQNRSCG